MATDVGFGEIISAAGDPHALTDGELRDLVLGSEDRHAEWVAARSALIAEFDSRGLGALDGAKTTAAWLIHRGGDNGAGTRQSVKLAKSLARMPGTHEALATGAIGVGKAKALAVGQRACPEEFGAAEAVLLATCRDLTADQSSKVVARWLDCVRPDGTEPERAEGSVLRIARTLDGWGDLQAHLAPEDLAAVDNLIAEQVQRDLRADGGGQLGEAEGRPSLANRRARALVELLTAGINADPSRRAVPSITVVVDLATFQAPTGTGLGPDGISEIDGVGPVPPEVVRRQACDAEVVPMLVDTGPRTSERAIDQRARILGLTNPEVLAVGRAMRAPNRAMRRALRVAQRGCQFPGCHVDAHWCVPHHIDHWEHRGPTDLQNLVLLCPFHHHLVHEGGFGIQRRGLDLTWHRPDGSVIETTRPNHLRLRPLPPAEPEPPPPEHRPGDPPGAVA